MLTEEQLAMRRTGITSTDISAICGLNRHKSAMEVYLEKVGRPIEHESTESQWWGLALEPVLAQRYLETVGSLVTPNEETWCSVRNPRMLATPDGFVKDFPRRWGVEVKTVWSAEQVKRWGGEKIPTINDCDAVPEEYLIQCAWCMGVCELDRWDICALLSTYHGPETRIYTLHRDLDLEARLIEIGEEFWAENVLKHAPPPPDGTVSAAAALRSIYPENREPLGVATEEQFSDIMELEAAEDEFSQAKGRREKAKQIVQGMIADAEGISGENWSVTWKTDKRGRRTFRTHFPEGGLT